MDEEAFLRSLAIQGASRPDSFSGMNPKFRSALVQMFSDAPPEIKSQVRIMSGYRSPARQKQLWEAALQKYGSPERARKWVAPPGNSQHNMGHASDLKYLSPDATKWAHANAEKYGLAFPLSNENWHIELAGVRGQRKDAGLAALTAGPSAVAEQPITMAAIQNKTADPVQDVMNVAAPRTAPMQQQAPGLANMYAQGPAAAPPNTVPMADPLAASQVAMPADTSLGGLAMMFGQQMQKRNADREAEAQAEATRRAALFQARPFPGVA